MLTMSNHCLLLGIFHNVQYLFKTLKLPITFNSLSAFLFDVFRNEI